MESCGKTTLPFRQKHEENYYCKMDHVDHLRQQKHKPMFKIIEPSMARAQFASQRDASFSSYLQPGRLHSQEQPQRTEDCDQISIFDAAEYFSGVHDGQKGQASATSPRVIDLSPMGRLSSVSSIDHNGNYRVRSFHATPTASSEASWSSRTGLLQANPSGSMGVGMIKIPSPSTSTTTNTTTTATTKWGKISSKWLIPGRKCPCSGKKSVQVEERIEPKTPRMVDLGRCSSSNGTKYPPSLYSTRQSSPKISPSNGNSGPNLIPKKFDYTCTSSSSSSTTIAAKNPIGCSCPENSSNNTVNGLLPFSSNPEVVSTITATTTTATTVAASTTTIAPTANGFTFPVLANPPVGVKKMFNVIAPDHHLEDPHRDSLEVFQPRSCPRSRRTSYEEDTALSDGSSDLFEIESFTTSNYNPSINNSTIKRFGSSVCRHSLDEETNGGDEVESVAPTECYAPSEVSIDWSVTTAEGFDRSSLANFSVSASEVGYAAMRREVANSRDSNDKRNNKGTVNNGGGLLMSCRCQKAVSVGPGPIKCPHPGEGLGPRNPARHVSGRAKEEAQTAAHVMINAAAAGNNLGGVGVVVGRSRPNLLAMPFAA